ncbi:MAG TPA: sigma-54 dependent transcriptional regulator [Bryobacteraceae bacterium]|jgi:DNA-binding NtrC family response regulator
MHLLWITSPDLAHADQQITSSLTGFNVKWAHSGREGLALLPRHSFDAAVVSAPLLDYPPEGMLEEIARLDSRPAILIRNRVGTVAEAVRCVKLGATQYFGPDILNAEQEALAIQHALESAVSLQTIRFPRRPAAVAVEEPWRKFLVGDSKAMRQVAQIVRLVGTRRCTVLVTGETGTGKELAARAIHMASSRSGGPLIAVNCSAIPENLLEAELFGHVKGAFTGATGARTGRFEEAHRGTLFLDEIADLPYGMQTKLLRVLQEKEIQRLGSGESIKVDFRLIAACNVNLEERIREGKFREDLFYRLNILPIEMPPLRERREDIPLLMQHFLTKVCAAESISMKEVSPETMERLQQHPWPGNVRQLENAVEMAVALSGDRNTLYPADFRLPSPVQWRPAIVDVPVPQVAVPESGLDFERVVGQFEKSLLDQALHHTNGNKKQAAEILRLKRTTFTAKLKSLEAVAGSF